MSTIVVIDDTQRGIGGGSNSTGLLRLAMFSGRRNARSVV
jgi:hypothetical protein